MDFKIKVKLDDKMYKGEITADKLQWTDTLPALATLQVIILTDAIENIKKFLSINNGKELTIEVK